LLRDSERQLRLVTDNAPIAIAQCDREARFKFVNRHYAERLGLTPEQVIGKPIPAVIGDKAWATLEPFFRECLGGKPVECDVEVEMPYQTSDPQFTHCCYEPEWRDGKVVGLVAAITNITALKRAEAALRESEAMFRAMFDVSSVGKIEVDPGSARFLRANAAMRKFVGYSEAELLARTVFDITHPDDRDREMCLVAGNLPAFDVEKRYIHKDGNVVWAGTTVNVIRDGAGRPLRNIAVIQDLNARKQAERDLQGSKDRLQLALDAAQLGWWQYDPLHRVFSGDARSQEVFEVTLEELIKLVHPEDVEGVLTALEARLDPINPNRSETEFRLRRRGGEVRWAETLGRAYFEGAGYERRAVSVVGTVRGLYRTQGARGKGAPSYARDQSSRQEHAQRPSHNRSPDRHQKSRRCRSDGGVHGRWRGRPSLCVLGCNLALELSSCECTGADESVSRIFTGLDRSLAEPSLGSVPPRGICSRPPDGGTDAYVELFRRSTAGTSPL
jgi:PAS domain S-box-containing protein